MPRRASPPSAPATTPALRVAALRAALRSRPAGGLRPGGLACSGHCLAGLLSPCARAAACRARGSLPEVLLCVFGFCAFGSPLARSGRAASCGRLGGGRCPPALPCVAPCARSCCRAAGALAAGCAASGSRCGWSSGARALAAAPRRASPAGASWCGSEPRHAFKRWRRPAPPRFSKILPLAPRASLLSRLSRQRNFVDRWRGRDGPPLASLRGPACASLRAGARSPAARLIRRAVARSHARAPSLSGIGPAKYNLRGRCPSPAAPPRFPTVAFFASSPRACVPPAALASLPRHAGRYAARGGKKSRPRKASPFVAARRRRRSRAQAHLGARSRRGGASPARGRRGFGERW